MRISLALSLLFSAASAARLEPIGELPLPSRVVYQFPSPSWVENIAVRSSGDLLLTMMTSPELYQLREPQGSCSKPELIHHFDSLNALLGIAETTEDSFIVVDGNFNGPRGLGIATPGTFSVWEVNLSATQPKVFKVVDIPEAEFLNGMVTNPSDKSEVLVADYSLGIVFKVDIKERKYQVAIDLPEMKPPTNSTQRSLNGLQSQNGFLYWTNSALGALSRVRVNRKGFVAEGAEVETVATTTSILDDFALDTTGTPWISTNVNNTILAISPSGESVVVAGSMSELTVAGASSVAFGRTPKDRARCMLSRVGASQSLSTVP